MLEALGLVLSWVILGLVAVLVPMLVILAVLSPKDFIELWKK